MPTKRLRSKPSARLNIPGDLRRSLRVEMLEERRLMAGLVYDAGADGLLWASLTHGDSEGLIDLSNVDLSNVDRTGDRGPSELSGLLQQAGKLPVPGGTSFLNDLTSRRGDSFQPPAVGPQFRGRNASGSDLQAASDLSASLLAAEAGTTAAVAGLPQLNSNPGAPATLYLDFDGHFEATWGSYTSVVTPVYDRDGDPNSMNAEEAAFIYDVWAMTAEDYAPFNINVTTIEPAVLAAGAPGSAANGVALRVAIGGTSAVLNDGDGVIGRGYINSFTSAVTNVAYVFPVTNSGTFSSAFTIGTVVSHEAGHSFGLQHQAGVYDFNAGWQGIMNSLAMGFEDAWWSKTDDQDDMAVLAGSLNGFGYRADDHADSIAGATPLTGSGTTFSGSGIIGVGGDVDVWSLTTSQAAGLKVSIAGSAKGQNLDAVVDLLDAQGNILLTANPSGSSDVELHVETTAETRYIAVRSTGAYGRIGQYSISTEAGVPGVTVNHPSSLATSEFGTSDTFSLSLDSKPTADVVIPVWSSDTSEGTTSVSQLIFTPANWYMPQSVSVTGADDAQVDGVALYTINLGPAASADADYQGLAIDSLAAANADNDVPGTAFQLEGSGVVYAADIEVGADGSIYISGNFSNTADFDPGSQVTAVSSNYLSDGFIAKYTASQELVWVQRYGSDSGVVFPRGLKLDSAGNPYIVGYTSSPTLVLGSTTLTTQGNNDAFLAKLNSDGTFLWAKSWGSTGYDSANALYIDANDTLVVGGDYQATVDFNPSSVTTSKTSAGTYDAYISKFDRDGKFLSVAVAGGSGDDFLRELSGDSSGNVFAVGTFSGTSQFGSTALTSAGGSDVYLFKLNAGGTIAWARQAAGIPASTTAPKVAVTSSGDIYFSGYFTESIDFGPGTTSLVSEGDSDLFLTKWSTTGALLQSGQISGPEQVRIADFRVDSSDRPILYGYFSGALDVDPTAGTVLRSSIGVQDDFILRLDASTQFSDFYQMPRSTGIPRALTTDRHDNIYASGSVHTAIAMPTGQQLQNAEGGYDAYVLKLAMAPGISLRSSLGLSTSENGAPATFGVVLDTPPTADVTISLSSSDPSEGTVSPSSITFTPANWNVPQLVTVSSVDDIFTDGDQLFNVVLGAAVSADPQYNALQPPSVSLVNQDDDRTIATFTRTDTRNIPDRGKLTSDLVVPSAGVLLDVDVRVNIEHTWNEDLDVFLIAPDGTRVELFTDVGGASSNFTNTILDASAAAGIAAGAAPFAGRFRPEGNLTLLNGKQQQGTWKLEITDDTRYDTGRLIDWSITTTSYIPLPPAGISVTPSSGLITTENGAAASFTVVLTSPLAANATIAVSSSDPSEGRVSVSSLTFTPANWNVPQSVTVTGLDDSITDGDVAYSIQFGTVVSTDSRYNGLQPTSVAAINRDNEAPVLVTKFYVVNDGSTDATYEYSATGSSVENYALGSGNSAPRGAASNAAGDKLWVVNSNRQVYVYNDRGTVLGSWTAGSISSSGVPEGITVSGNDVWIVDNASNKVFRYSAAASRLSGSQNAASSFALNSANRNPKDLVTDGTNIWVVNDGTTDVVFKYTLSGSLVGSWTIGSANASPTGITLDPTGASQSLWIVDSGTDRVYEYASARSKSSGSLTASVSFALAAGNTNPQGIADPPPAALLQSDMSAPPAPQVSALIGNERKSTTGERAVESNQPPARSAAPVRIGSQPNDAPTSVLAVSGSANEPFGDDDLFEPIDDELLSVLSLAKRVDASRATRP